MNTVVEKAIQDWVSDAMEVADGAVRWAQQDAARPVGAITELRSMAVRRIGQDAVETVDNPLVIANDAVESVDDSANTLTLTAHGLETGDGPVRFTTTDTLPAGLELATDYYVIAASANAIKLAETAALALAGTPVDLTDTGAGVHTLVDTDETVRVGEEITVRVRGTRLVTLAIQAFAGGGVGLTGAVGRLETLMTRSELPSIRTALAAAGIGLLDFGLVQSLDGRMGMAFEPRAVLEARLLITAEASELGAFIGSVAIENELTETTVVVEL